MVGKCGSRKQCDIPGPSNVKKNGREAEMRLERSPQSQIEKGSDSC